MEKSRLEQDSRDRRRKTISLFLVFTQLLFGSSSILVGAQQDKLQMRDSVSILNASSGSQKTASSSLLTSQAEPTPRVASKVFFVRNEKVMSPKFAVNAPLVSTMLRSLVCAVTGKKTTKEAWQSLITVGKEGDRIGIKVATESGLLAGTHRELVESLLAELIEAGVTPEHLLVWDRRQKDLEVAGYTHRTGLPLQWMEHGSGYDPKLTFSHPILGQLMYGDTEFKEKAPSLKESLYLQDQFSNESHYSLILSQRVDKVINMPSLCDSWYCGINGALANMSIGVVDNWRRFVKAPFFGVPYIADLYKSEPIHSKVIMTIMDGLALQYAGGPKANPSHTTVTGMLLASLDPVALDATALHFINEQRLLAHLPKIGEAADHIQAAEAAGLGKAATNKILTLRVGASK